MHSLLDVSKSPWSKPPFPGEYTTNRDAAGTQSLSSWAMPLQSWRCNSVSESLWQPDRCQEGKQSLASGKEHRRRVGNLPRQSWTGRPRSHGAMQGSRGPWNWIHRKWSRRRLWGQSSPCPCRGQDTQQGKRWHFAPRTMRIHWRDWSRMLQGCCMFLKILPWMCKNLTKAYGVGE